MTGALALLDELAAPPARPAVSIGALANERTDWEFERAEIERAALALGIARPIVLGTTRGRTAGGHQFDRCDERGAYHEVRVSAYFSAFGASEVIWHELAHAQQSERFESPADFDRAYNAHGRKGAAYRANPFEVEARGFERMAADWPLAVRR